MFHLCGFTHTFPCNYGPYLGMHSSAAGGRALTAKLTETSADQPTLKKEKKKK